jgi:uncharacterized membrane protein
MSALSNAVTTLAALPVAIQIHIATASLGVLLGPVALTARKGSLVHRSVGYTWLLSMVLAAVTAMFIRDYNLPNIAGYTPIHLLVPFTAYWVVRGLWAAINHRVVEHRRAMKSLYISACVVAGLFTLLPQRTLGKLLWEQTLGWV